jgi:uncharacterized protein YhaN
VSPEDPASISADVRIRVRDAEGAQRELEGEMALVVKADRAVEDARDSWNEWLREAGFPSGMAPSEARALLASARQTQIARVRADDAHKRQTRARAAVGRFEQLASEIGVDAGGSPDALPSLVRAAKAEALETREAERARDEIAQELKEARRESEGAHARFKSATHDYDEVLSRAEASTDVELESAAAGAQQEADEARDRVELLTEERAKTVGSLGDEEREDRQAALSLEVARVTEELRVAVTEYTTLELAARLLTATLDVYERERQPGVVRRAEEMFATITDGRYERLTSPVGTTFDPYIEGSVGAAKGKERLSTGTAQQLYLALRLAYLESLTDSPVALPILMDDVLVNFDEERRDETARLLVEFAKARQTVFFTCHEATAETLSAAATGDIVRLKLTHC